MAISVTTYDLIPVRRDGQVALIGNISTSSSAGYSTGAGTTYSGGTNILITGSTISVCGTVPSASVASNALALCGCTPACFLGTTACACDSARLGNVLASCYARKYQPTLEMPCFTGLAIAEHLCVCCDFSANNFYTSSVVYQNGSAVCPAIRFCDDPTRGIYKDVNNDLVSTAGLTVCERITMTGGMSVGVNPNYTSCGYVQAFCDMLINAMGATANGCGCILICSNCIKGTGNICTSGNVTATCFIGCGAGLTGVGGATCLDALNDVVIATPAANQILQYSGTIWCNCTPSDITSNLTNGQILYYNGTTICSCCNNNHTHDYAATNHTHSATCITSGTLTAARLPIASASCLGGIRIGTGLSIDANGIVCSTATGGAACLDALCDVAITSAACNNILQHNGTQFVNCTPTDITSNLTTAQLLCYNGTTICSIAPTSLTVGTANNALALCSCVPSCFAAATHYHTNICYSSAIKAAGVASGLCVCGCGFATDFIASSDVRLKKDIAPIYNAISLVDRLYGVQYKLCADSTSTCRIGLIAQDVQKVLPEVVCIGSDGMLGITYEKLVPVLIEAIKQLQKQITNMKYY